MREHRTLPSMLRRMTHSTLLNYAFRNWFSLRRKEILSDSLHTTPINYVDWFQNHITNTSIAHMRDGERFSLSLHLDVKCGKIWFASRAISLQTENLIAFRAGRRERVEEGEKIFTFQWSERCVCVTETSNIRLGGVEGMDDGREVAARRRRLEGTIIGLGNSIKVNPLVTFSKTPCRSWFTSKKHEQPWRQSIPTVIPMFSITKQLCFGLEWARWASKSPATNVMPLLRTSTIQFASWKPFLLSKIFSQSQIPF